MDVIIAGFGGQGVLVSGQILAQAGLLEGKNVTFLPVYGSEVRGGTAHTTVIISDEEIYYPYIEKPSNAIVLNRPSLDRYEPLIASGGILVINSAIIDKKAEREDINAVYVPGNSIAEEIGSDQVVNIVLLGAFVTATEVVSLDSVMASIKTILPERRHNLLPLNNEALKRGAAACKEGFVSGGGVK